MKQIKLKSEQIQDVLNVVNGAYFPLTGFLRATDFESVLENMRLVNGAIWSIPVVLDIDENKQLEIKDESELELVDENGEVVATLQNIEIYKYDRAKYAVQVFGTLDQNHPGVKDVFAKGEYLVGGEIIPHHPSPYKREGVNSGLYLSPEETKQKFKELGWKKIVAFQTRNVPHRSHEFLQKEALKHVDGLFIQPVIGKKKNGDFKDDVIIEAYKILLEKYYDSNKALLGLLPIRMNYAGPKEALMHALIRRNYGCTHMIIGRDHAGVGDYYGAYDAHNIFDNFSPEELGIEIFKFNNASHCTGCGQIKFEDDCSHEERINLSGTKIRDIIKNKGVLPKEIIRQEIAEYLLEHPNPFVSFSKENFVIWLTGLPCSGKTTLGKALKEKLKKENLHHLDGDEVRARRTDDLGFSSDGRDKNIELVIDIVREYQEKGVSVIASFIAPYKKHRQWGRERLNNYIEVFVDSPLSLCEERDVKGMYKKARLGEIKNFTGIDDPYERPESPDLHIKTANRTVEECVEEIIIFVNSF